MYQHLIVFIHKEEREGKEYLSDLARESCRSSVINYVRRVINEPARLRMVHVRAGLVTWLGDDR